MSRAAPLPPEDRRATIIAATERLIVEQGASVSTRAIAAAAGIAEGTIFRVFPTKEAIIEAIFDDVFDRTSLGKELAEIDRAAPLRTRMIQVMDMLQKRSSRIMALYSALGMRPLSGVNMSAQKEAAARTLAQIAAVFENDRPALTVTPPELARLVQSLVITVSWPGLTERVDYSAEALVSILLDGVARTDFSRAIGHPLC